MTPSCFSVSLPGVPFGTLHVFIHMACGRTGCQRRGGTRAMEVGFVLVALGEIQNSFRFLL